MFFSIVSNPEKLKQHKCIYVIVSKQVSKYDKKLNFDLIVINFMLLMELNIIQRHYGLIKVFTTISSEKWHSILLSSLVTRELPKAFKEFVGQSNISIIKDIVVSGKVMLQKFLQIFSFPQNT